jgi:hypothetical protein
MKKLLMILPLVFLFCFTFAGQQKENELPELTPVQRWERASNQMTVMMVGAISYAKSMGQSAEQFGEYQMKLFAPSWGEPDTGSLNIIRGVYYNFMMWAGSKFEIVESSDVSVTARSNRPWAMHFDGDKPWYGVTLEEVEEYIGTTIRLLAEYLGLDYKSEVKEGWLYLTFGMKK